MELLRREARLAARSVAGQVTHWLRADHSAQTRDNPEADDETTPTVTFRNGCLTQTRMRQALLKSVSHLSRNTWRQTS